MDNIYLLTSCLSSNTLICEMEPSAGGFYEIMPPCRSPTGSKCTIVRHVVTERVLGWITSTY